MNKVLLSLILLLSLSSAYACGYSVGDVAVCKAEAEQGDAEAQHNLGWRYTYGQGVIKDDKQAAKWTRKAAEQGHARAQYGLAVMYKYGQGVLQHYKQAAEWYRKSAEQGFELAQVALGNAYSMGDGVRQDNKQAVKWYLKAAEQGYVEAVFMLGRVYEDGKVPSYGKEQQAVKAHMYYNIAAANGHIFAPFSRKRMEKRMTPSQIAEAQDLAREWMRKH